MQHKNIDQIKYQAVNNHILQMKNIAIFASGAGTNTENIIKHFKNSTIANVKLVLSDNKNAYVLERAKNLDVPVITFSKKEFNSIDNKEKYLGILKEKEIDYIILAGFLSKIPEYIINEYPEKILNIHPALLPKFGGKGMYGANVHRAIIDNNEDESGITIHIVDNEYDHGDNIFQTICRVEPDETAESLETKIHSLEKEYFPIVIEQYILNGKNTIIEGMSYTSTTIVCENNSAIKMGSGNLPVFATPSMIALMENAAMNVVTAKLAKGLTTVGGSISSTHLKPSIYGKTIKATAILEKIDRKKLIYKVAAYDGKTLIGEGDHIRFIVKEDFYK